MVKKEDQTQAAKDFVSFSADMRRVVADTAAARAGGREAFDSVLALAGAEAEGYGFSASLRLGGCDTPTPGGSPSGGRTH